MDPELSREEREVIQRRFYKLQGPSLWYLTVRVKASSILSTDYWQTDIVIIYYFILASGLQL